MQLSASSIRSLSRQTTPNMVHAALYWFVTLFFICGQCMSHPICLDSTFPVNHTGTFTKCTKWNNLNTCVDPADESTAIVEPTYSPDDPPSAECASMMTDISCAVVDQFSGHLFRAEGAAALDRPILCPNYCTALYNACNTTLMADSPFVNKSTVLTTMNATYSTVDDFCNTFADFEYCFDGTPYTIGPPTPFIANFSICVERVIMGGVPKVSFQPVPDYPDLLMVGDLEGVVKIYAVNNTNTGDAFEEISTLLDIRSFVKFEGERGLLGVAMHKNFSQNGRFYVSFSCLGPSAGIDCELGDSIIDEYRVDEPSNPKKLQANTTTRRRIFRLLQPFANHNGGQVLFSPDPAEPHLFFMLGDGGSGGDPGNRAQPLSSLYGKVLRMDVDANFETGGLAAIPSDNPFVGVSGAEGLIWANGLRNPWRCSFDTVTYIMYCGDVGQDRREEIDVIAKGANYGWRKFEGTLEYNADTVLDGSQTITFPIIEYDHSEVTSSGGSSVTGGYVVHSNRDRLIKETYIFADTAGALFVASESPRGSGQWSKARIGIQCANYSALGCTSQGAIESFGEMWNGDIVFGDSNGNVHRIRENVNCTDFVQVPPLTSAPTSSSSALNLVSTKLIQMVTACITLFVLG